MVTRRTLESLHNAEALITVITQKIDALPPARRAEYLDWLTDLEADYTLWRKAALRGRRTLGDIQAELRVGHELQKRTPPGWVTVR